VLALLSPEGAGVAELAGLELNGDPGVIRLDPVRRTLDVGTIAVNY
jgi:hypothetical protein